MAQYRAMTLLSPVLLRLGALCAAVALLGACGSSATYELVFPSQETFLISNNATVTVYKPEERTPDEICRNLSASLPAGESNSTSSGSLDVCQFATEEGVTINDVPTGRVVFFADVVGGPERLPILRGCTVADVYADSTDVVTIQLSTLPNYPDDVELICAGTEAKCEQNQPCLGDT
jgi:hypothetical protein